MADPPDGQAEIAWLNRIIVSLMDRAERTTSDKGSDFSIFQTAIVLEEQVRQRTAELEGAARENEKITRALRESEAKFRGLVSQSMVGIVMIDGGKSLTRTRGSTRSSAAPAPRRAAWGRSTWPPSAIARWLPRTPGFG